MPKRLELTGRRFGRWKVISRCNTRRLSGPTYFRCRCRCGTRRRVLGVDLNRGISQSCGCLIREITSRRSRTHGMTGTSEFTCWQSMIQRCTNPRSQAWKDYGGRGIKVCARWRNSFQTFFSDMGRRPPGKTLDRRKNDRGYTPSNCRWASWSVQNRNQRRRRCSR
jgi:hypothetical protein